MFDYVVNSLEKGGWVLLPIFLTSVFGWVIIFQAWLRLNRLTPSGRGWVRKLRYPRAAERWLSNLRKSDTKTLPVIVLQHVNSRRTKGRKTMLEAYEVEMKSMIPEMEKGLTTLGVLAGVAPLLGLLGTVSGMVSTFEVISVFGAGNPALMADSIGEALVTTQNGLLAAIPLMLGHILLLNRSLNLENETEKAVHRFVNYMERQS